MPANVGTPRPLMQLNPIHALNNLSAFTAARPRTLTAVTGESRDHEVIGGYLPLG